MTTTITTTLTMTASARRRRLGARNSNTACTEQKEAQRRLEMKDEGWSDIVGDMNYGWYVLCTYYV